VPGEPQAFEEEHLLDDLQRAIAGDEKAPPPPLQPEVSKTVITGKRVMLAFLSNVPGVSTRAADAVSGFFQDIGQIWLADVIDIADIPGVAPAEARLIKVAVARFLAPGKPPKSPKRVPSKAPAARAAPEVASPQPPPRPVPKPSELPARRPGVAPAPRPSGFELRRGMVNGRGHVNGRGRVNGIINGTGFVNGVALAKLELPRRNLVPRYVTIGVSLLMLFAFAALYYTGEEGPTGILIDGYFGDWSNESVPVYVGGTVSGNSRISIVDSSVHVDRTRILLRVRVQGAMFGNPTDWETMYAFLDVDGDETIGYDLGDMGADYVVRVSGSRATRGLVEDARLLRYDAGGRSRDDWAGFVSVGPVEANATGAQVVDGSQVEVSVPRAALLDFDEQRLRVRFALDDNAGETSHTLVPIGTQAGALLVEQSPVTTTLSGGPQPFLTLTFTSLGSHPLAVEGVQLVTRGGAVINSDFLARFDVSLLPVPRTITVDASGLPIGTLVTAVVTDVRVTTASGSVPFAIVGREARAYVSAPPAGKVIDGLFADWPAPMPDTDPAQVWRRSLNILGQDGNVTGNRISLYARFGGDVLEGGLTPVKPARPPPSGPGGGPTAAPAVPPPPVVGQDYIRFFVDTDARTPGGFDVGGISADHFFQIRGRGGRVLDASVYSLGGSDWVRQGSLDWGLDGDEIEVGATLAGVPFNGTQFVAVAADWAGVADRTDLTSTRGAASEGTRSSPEPPVVMDVSGNGPFWFRDTNHATENACTYNKVASSTKGSGPAKMLNLSTTETACWYVDATTGQTIPTGVWETLMDISNTGGADYDVLIQIWNLDTNNVAETIQMCNDQTSFGDDIRCFADPVAQKTLSSTQVVRIVFAHSAASGTVTIEYDDSDTTGDSRATLPIPEFGEVAITAMLAVFVVLASTYRRRRAQHSR